MSSSLSAALLRTTGGRRGLWRPGSDPVDLQQIFGTCTPSRAALMSGRYGTRFGFEFTPTPAGFSTMVPRLANSTATRSS